MNILALDAACGHAASAVLRSDGSQFEAESEGKNPHSVAILPLLEKVLAEARLSWNDLDLLALGLGPGSFTGLRIAASTLAGINTGLKLPMLGISSLAITAIQTDSEAPICVFEDARAGDAYVGYFAGGEALQDDQSLAWSQVLEIQPGSFASQSEPPVDLSEWHRLELKTGRSQALGKAVLASTNSVELSLLPRFLLPAYLRPSQAERAANNNAG
ncbi:MAG: tRNA (adenosine(37)-N6)-threonylcarbamoyltransferase complex dimerization subunit type 1 TsaB [Mariprofundaceae bacterium]